MDKMNAMLRSGYNSPEHGGPQRMGGFSAERQESPKSGIETFRF
jgi:hypothetical protein